MSNFLVCVPFTGLGLYNGFRGNRWLRNRIRIFETFVVPSLKAQSDQDFTLWVAWRSEERTNKYVVELYERLKLQFNVVFTYSGVPFWDDKYSDKEASERLSKTLKNCLPELLDVTADSDKIHWLLQPSDDIYHINTISNIKKVFKETDNQAVTYTKGYICNYNTKELLEYTPKTNPPFFAINFPRATFFDPAKHMKYTGPYKSHEYIGNALKMAYFDFRGFIVGTHGENISTHFKHPYGGAKVENVFKDFGIDDIPPITLQLSLRKLIMRRLPHRWQRKLRYLIGEKFVNKIYEFLRN